MIIKDVGDHAQDIAMLQSLLNRSDVGTYKRKNIVRQLNNIRKGLKGEKNAAYHINFHVKNSKNWAVVHDVRFEHAGRVAQIDHLLINRFLEIWVCESKYWANGISINEYGEFTCFYGKSPIGIASPLEQNLNHITFLNEMFREQVVAVPQRLGVPLKPKLMSAVLVSTNARIDRPKTKIEGLESIVKVDQFINNLVKKTETPSLSLLKVVSSKTLENFALELTAAHKPKQRDWASSFGLAKEPPQPAPPKRVLPRKIPEQAAVAQVPTQRPTVERNPAINQSISPPPPAKPSEAPAQDQKLFACLKAKRLEIATKIAKPAYVVFSDKTLREMVQLRPANRDAMLKVVGVGPMKFEQYGAIFLDVISKTES